MLRGWDEGYETPSLGIAIREGYRDRGLGRQVMSALHDVVRVRGGHRVRLRVAEGNARARHLYASMGYRQVGVERGELVLVLDFCLGGTGSELATLAQRPRGVCPDGVQTARPHHRTMIPTRPCTFPECDAPARVRFQTVVRQGIRIPVDPRLVCLHGHISPLPPDLAARPDPAAPEPDASSPNRLADEPAPWRRRSDRRTA